MKDLHSRIAIDQSIAPAVYAADNVPVAVDLLGFDSAEIEIGVGVGGITFSGTNKIEFVATHSDDGLTYDPVADKDLLGVSGISGGIIKSLVTAHASADVSRFGYIGGRRYVKLLADFSGTHGTGTPISANIIKGNPDRGQS